MPKWDFNNKVAKQLIEIIFQHDCSRVYLLHIFGTPFSKNTTGGLLLQFCIHINPSRHYHNFYLFYAPDVMSELHYPFLYFLSSLKLETTSGITSKTIRMKKFQSLRNFQNYSRPFAWFPIKERVWLMPKTSLF